MPRRPDPPSQLNFIQNDQSGQVHVERWWSDERTPTLRRAAELRRAAVDDEAANLTAWLVYGPPLVALRGTVLHQAQGTPGYGFGVTSFPDEAICPRCVRSLGDQSWLAFQHPQPSEGDEG